MVISEFETEEKNVNKTESPEVLKRNTSLSLLQEYPPEEATENIMVLESDSDEEIEVV